MSDSKAFEAQKGEHSEQTFAETHSLVPDSPQLGAGHQALAAYDQVAAAMREKDRDTYKCGHKHRTERKVIKE